MEAKRDWLTMKEAAQELGVSRQRLHQIVDEINVPIVKINPRLTVISAEKVAELKKNREST